MELRAGCIIIEDKKAVSEGCVGYVEVADFHELGLLCLHFEVDKVLETGMFGCFRFPARGKRGLAQVSLVALEGRFGYLPQRCKGSARRVVRCAERDE